MPEGGSARCELVSGPHRKGSSRNLKSGPQQNRLEAKTAPPDWPIFSSKRMAPRLRHPEAIS
eukprot:1184249-Prorocentrum_minimum.AAC.7